MGPQGFWGSGENYYFCFRELGSTCNYFWGAREQAYNFGDIGSFAKKKKIGKASILFDFLKILLLLGASPYADPLVNSKCIYFCTYMLIKIDLIEKYGN